MVAFGVRPMWLLTAALTDFHTELLPGEGEGDCSEDRPSEVEASCPLLRLHAWKQNAHVVSTRIHVYVYFRYPMYIQRCMCMIDSFFFGLKEVI